MTAHPPSRAVVDLAAFAHNLDAVRNYVGPGVRIMAAVKGDAYGHGLIPMARHAAAWGVHALGVATVDEGIALREADITTPLYLLFEPTPDALDDVVAHDLTLVLATRETGEAIARIAEKHHKTATVHCQIDTGMGRQGFDAETGHEDVAALARLRGLELEGICTHYPLADAPDSLYTHEQTKRFAKLVEQLDADGVPFDLVHSSNSAAVVNFKASHFDLVRPGIMLYGVWPSEAPQPKGRLRQVLRWETQVVQVREMPPGSGISYGHTFYTREAMRTAILPVGYADGYRRQFSNQADVLIHGKRCPVRGTVCMDQTVVDVTHLPNVQAGDTAVLIGKDGKERITAEELAPFAGTIPYEILTGIGNRTSRVYINGTD